MSMPSSSDDVATTHGSRPDFRSSSTRSAARGTSSRGAPWPAPAARPCEMPGRADRLRGELVQVRHLLELGGSSFSRAVSRSASRREFVNTIVERCRRDQARECGPRRRARSTSRRSAPGRRTGHRACALRLDRLAEPWTCPRPAPATRDLARSWCSSAARAAPAGRRPGTSLTSSIGRTVADRPIRCAGLSSRASSRSRDSARCAPRFVPATACTSSTITVSHAAQRLAARRGEQQEQRLRGGHQDVRRGARNALRSSAGVSPVRMPTVMFGSGSPSRSGAALIPASGARRLRSTSTASAFSGET